MVGDAAANAAIARLNRDSCVPILFRPSKSGKNSNTDEKMTCEGVVCGIANILVATLAATTGCYTHSCNNSFRPRSPSSITYTMRTSL
jgi:hypothetical protein